MPQRCQGAVDAGDDMFGAGKKDRGGHDRIAAPAVPALVVFVDADGAHARVSDQELSSSAAFMRSRRTAGSSSGAAKLNRRIAIVMSRMPLVHWLVDAPSTMNSAPLV